MKRSLKFRVWNGKDNKWDDPSLVEIFNSNGVLGHLYDPNGEYTTIQQYTGIKDKNDVEIYGGDIIRGRFGSICSDGVLRPDYADGEIHIAEIYYADWCAEWLFSCERTENRYDFIFPINDIWSASECEIIGNIFENPELLQT